MSIGFAAFLKSLWRANLNTVKATASFVKRNSVSSASRCDTHYRCASAKSSTYFTPSA